MSTFSRYSFRFLEDSYYENMNLDNPTQNLGSNRLTRDQYILGGLRIQNRSTYGTELALLASIILAGSSIPRAIRSGKPLPIGLSVLATFGLWAFGNAFVNRQRTV